MQAMIEKAKRLKKKYGAISIPFLQMKLKITHSMAEKIYIEISNNDKKRVPTKNSCVF